MEKKRILLVDDEKDIVTTTKYFLEQNGYHVDVAHDGHEALAKAKEEPHMVLLDAVMPGLDGFQVLQRLRIDPSTEKIPVIMLTCKADTRCILEAQQLKATDYLIKTSSFEDLLNILKKYLDANALRPVDI